MKIDTVFEDKNKFVVTDWDGKEQGKKRPSLYSVRQFVFNTLVDEGIITYEDEIERNRKFKKIVAYYMYDIKDYQRPIYTVNENGAKTETGEYETVATTHITGNSIGMPDKIIVYNEN